MNKITVSVVCTNYNKGEWIRDAIESFLAQKTKFDYEIILIDDGSTDISPKIIEEYVANYPDRIRTFYNKKNLGITKTWIKVCEKAKGEYIARCDGDDYWIDSGKLQKQVELLEKNKDSLWCSTDYNIITPAGKLTHSSAFESKLVDRSDSYAEMLATKGFTMASTWLVDANLMREINADVDNSAVDDTFNIQLDLFNKTKLTYLPEATVVYRLNNGSDSRPIKIGKIRSRNERLLKTQLEYIEKYKDVDYGEILKILLRRNMQNEMWAIERLQIVHEQQRHIKQQEAYIKKLEGIIHAITESRSYRLAVMCAGVVWSVAHTPIKVKKKVIRLAGNYRYKKYFIKNLQTNAQLKREQELVKKLSYQPLISIIVPTYNTPKRYFTEMVDSVKRQTYSNWELVLIDDASPDKSIHMLIRSIANKDKRVTCKFLESNQHIAGATNEGFRLARGEFVALLDHDDVLQPNALFEIVKALNENRNIDFIYTDEDKVTGEDRHIQPFIKPDWNPDFLHSVNYITHFTAIRKSILDNYGGEDSAFNGAQDWELFLRIARNIPPDHVYHIQKILYSWRMHNDSTAEAVENKPYVVEAQKNSIQTDLHARGQEDFLLQQDIRYSGQWQLEFYDKALSQVLIVVSDKENTQVISDQIRKNTAYANYKIINAAHNIAYEHILNHKSEYIVFVDGQLVLYDDTWLSRLVGDAARDEIGFVLAQIADNEVMENLKPLLGDEKVNLIRQMDPENVSKRLYLTARYNIGTIQSTNGVLIASAEKIREAIPDASAKIDLTQLSMEFVKNGYRNLYNPYVKMLK